MKLKFTVIIFFSMIFLVVGCSKNETVENKLILPEDTPGLVEESDFDKIDWDKKL